MTDDVAIWNPNLDRPAKRRVEEVAKDDESKGPKQAKRPREESDEQADGTAGSRTSLDKEPPIIDDESPLSNEDDGTGAEDDKDVEEDSDVEEVSGPEEDYQDYPSSPDYGSDNNCCYVVDGKFYGWCVCCVPDEVCKRCGNKNGYPPGEYDRYNPLKCNSCRTTGEHKDGDCVIRHIVKRLGRD